MVSLDGYEFYGHNRILYIEMQNEVLEGSVCLLGLNFCSNMILLYLMILWKMYCGLKFHQIPKHKT